MIGPRDESGVGSMTFGAAAGTDLDRPVDGSRADTLADLVAAYEDSAVSAAPAYERIKTAVTDHIRSGRWSEGYQLPSENQLVTALGLSRMTVNRALRELAADGRIVRTMGVGSFVATTKGASPLLEVRDIADEVAARGHVHHAEVITLTSGEPDDPVLRRELPGWAFHSVVVHFEGETPIQVEDRWVSPREVPGYLDQDFTAITPHDYLERTAPLVRGEHVVEAVRAAASDCELLRIDRDEPCLLIRRRTWSARALVSSARLIHPGAVISLRGTFDVDR